MKLPVSFNKANQLYHYHNLEKIIKKLAFKAMNKIKLKQFYILSHTKVHVEAY